MFMGRPIRVSRSRRFSKIDTKLSDQTGGIATLMNPNSEPSGEGDDI